MLENSSISMLDSFCCTTNFSISVSVFTLFFIESISTSDNSFCMSILNSEFKILFSMSSMFILLCLLNPTFAKRKAEAGTLIHFARERYQKLSKDAGTRNVCRFARGIRQPELCSPVDVGPEFLITFCR